MVASLAIQKNLRFCNTSEVIYVESLRGIGERMNLQCAQNWVHRL